MQLYQTNFLTINLHENFIELIWTKESERAKAEDFKVWNNAIADMVEKHSPTCMLANCLNYFFTITPELQEWSVENVFNRFEKAGLKRLAMLMSTAFISQLSIEQFVEEANTSLITRYYDNESLAKDWLLK